jgi:polysaccharide biosynthesis protein PslG
MGRGSLEEARLDAVMRGRVLSRCRRAAGVAGRRSTFETLEPRLCLSAPELTDTNPFGVSTSAQSTGSFGAWGPVISQAGVKWLRICAGWNQIQPSQGTWNWSATDSIMATAAKSNINLSWLFAYNAPWLSGGYPTGSGLTDWATYVSGVVSHCKDSIAYWEVWNEPENFGKVPATAYGSMVATAYTAAHAADPSAQVGMSIASLDITYMEQAIKSGAADKFDYICVHPYEIFGTVDSGQEADYMSVVPTIRKMLAAVDPAKANVPIWFTEIGTAVGYGNTTLATQAQDVIKAYTMGIAQGAAHIEWFEAKEGGYQMGLLDSANNPNPGYTALKNLTANLGPNPQYKGWVELNNKDYGFVFQGATTTVMVTWAPPGATDNVNFGSSVQILDPVSGSVTKGSTYSLTNAPVLVVGVPAGLLTQAQNDKGLPFPWLGDYTSAQSVSETSASPNVESGLHGLGSSTTVYGGSAYDCSKSPGTAFTVDPNFLSYTPTSIQITAVVRRDAANDNAGFNLKYESTTGRKSTGAWFTIPGNDKWYTKTWTITDDEFVSDWGYNFSFDSDTTAYSKYYIQSVTVTKLNVTTPSPTVAVAASATPNPVTGNMTSLSVLGADNAGESNLSYTWAVNGPSGVAFSTNGSNAAKNTTATFSQPGAYTFVATMANRSGLTASSNVTVIVNQTLTTIVVSPASVNLNPGQTQRYTATAKDQFDTILAPQPSFTWATTAGTLSTGIVLTAPSEGTSGTVTASSGTVSGTATFNVGAVSQPPTVAISASASPNPLTGLTTNLSVLGADSAGEATLSYTWSKTSGPGGVTFSINGTNGAKNTTATLAQSGTYVLTVTIMDQGGLTATSSITVPAGKIVPAVLLASSANPSTYNQPITLTATISGAPGLSPTGSVDFLDGSTWLGTTYLDSSGVATCTVPSLSVASHSIVANYSGDVSFAPAASNTLNQIAKSPTSELLAVSPSVSVGGQKATILAFVRVPAGVAVMPTGSVTLLDGTTVLGTATLNAAGAAAIIVPLAAGTHSLSISYGGDPLCKPSISPQVLQAIAPLVTGIVAGSGNAQATHSFNFRAQASVGPTFAGTLSYSDAANSVSLASVTLSTLAMSSANTHATILGTAKLNDASGYVFNLDVDLWDGQTSSDPHQFSITITGPSSYRYTYSGPLDTGTVVQFLKAKSASVAALLPAVTPRSATAATQTDAALSGLLAASAKLNVRARFGR